MSKVVTVFFFISSVSIMILAGTPAYSHGGGLDKYGCHNNRRTKEYHCHRKKTRKLPRSIIKKMLRTGNCYDSLSPWYYRARYYAVYDTMEECLRSGGKAPYK